VKNFNDQDVFSKDFTKKIRDCFSHLIPFHDYFSDVLTSDLNGQSIL
jgi:hypothetical protein